MLSCATQIFSPASITVVKLDPGEERKWSSLSFCWKIAPSLGYRNKWRGFLNFLLLLCPWSNSLTSVSIGSVRHVCRLPPPTPSVFSMALQYAYYSRIYSSLLFDPLQTSPKVMSFINFLFVTMGSKVKAYWRIPPFSMSLMWLQALLMHVRRRRLCSCGRSFLSDWPTSWRKLISSPINFSAPLLWSSSQDGRTRGPFIMCQIKNHCHQSRCTAADSQEWRKVLQCVSRLHVAVKGLTFIRGLFWRWSISIV